MRREFSFDDIRRNLEECQRKLAESFSASRPEPRIATPPRTTQISRRPVSAPRTRQPSAAPAVPSGRIRRQSTASSVSSIRPPSSLDDRKKDQPSHYRTVQEIADDRRKKLEEECPFQPKLVSQYPLRKTRRGGRPIHEQLYESRREAQIRNEKIRKRKEDREIAKSCTFAPNSRGRRRKSRASAPSEEFFEYLSHSQDTRQSDLELKRRQIDQQSFAKDCPFRPKIGRSRRAVSLIQKKRRENPNRLFQRVGELQRSREEALRRAREKRFTEDPDLRFRPQVSKVSRRLAQLRKKKARFRDFAEKRRMDQIRREKEQECTFKPTICSGSKKIVTEDETFEVGFVDRQAEYEARISRRKRQLEEQQAARNPSRKPSRRLSSSELEKASHRLSVEAAASRRYSIDQCKKRIEAAQGAVFKPRLSKGSKNARPTGFHELVNNHRAEENRKRRRREQQEKIAREHSFRPKRVAALASDRMSQNSKYRVLSSDLDVMSRKIEVRRRQREREVARRKAEAQNLEAEGCTFHPQIRKPNVETGQVRVPGLENFLKKCDLARRIQEDKQRRYDRVFNRFGKQSRKKSRRNYTVPKPFNLHEGNDYDVEYVKRLARLGEEEHDLANTRALFAS